MKPATLIDSVILIDHLRGIPQAIAWLRSLRDGEGIISVITRAEVLSGGTEAESAAGFDLCELFPCLPLSRETADFAAKLRRSHHWRLPDAFQAALAMSHGLRLATRNSRDFNPKAHSFALIPYRID